MYLGFIVSLLLHAAVLGWALVSFQLTRELPAPEIPMIEATLVTQAELTRLKQGDPNAKVLESKPQDKPNPDKAPKEAPKPKPVATAPPPPAAEPTPPEPEPPKPPEPAKSAPEPPKPDAIADKMAALAKEPPPAPEPTPGPTPDEQKKLEEKLEQERKADEQKKAEEKRKAEEKKKADEKKKAEEKKRKEEEHKKRVAEAKRKAEEKKKFDATKLSALLNKIPDSAAAPQASSAPPTQPTTHTGPSAGERQGNDTVLTASEIAMIGSLIKQHIKNQDCWHFQAGAVGAKDLAVKLELRFQPDGRLAAEPRVANASSNPQFGFAAESAIRAVKACEPFNMLPAEKYATIWKHMYFTFDPSSLF